jgi:hypothetical protein
MLALLGGCKPADDAAVVAPPEPEPEPVAPQADLDELLRNVVTVGPGAAQSQQQLNEIREAGPADAASSDYGLAKTLNRLIYQCRDDATFSVRVVGNRLEVFPPKHSNGFIVLARFASDDGVHYASADADFRAKDDLATLRVGRDRYVDCVSNPAAAVWQDLSAAFR